MCGGDAYIDECEELMDECDLIVIMDDNLTFSSAYFKNKDEYFMFNLTDYALTETNFIIPKNLLLDVRASDNFLAELNYSKITANKELKMNFSIPKRYVEVQ